MSFAPGFLTAALHSTDKIAMKTLFACRLAGLALLLSLPFTVVAQSDPLPMPLESRDPAKPLEVLADQTWTGPEIQAQAKDFSRLEVGHFIYEAGKGPVTLLVDYAAARPGKDVEGEALIDVGIECPEAREPCAIPITLGVIGIRTGYMGESVIKVGNAPEAAWVGRESHAYTFPDKTYVEVRLALQGRSNLEPRAIRARVFYGDYSREALPGQKTRSGLMLKIAAVLGALLALFFWWLRRD
jgi:hypothetical protein